MNKKPQPIRAISTPLKINSKKEIFMENSSSLKLKTPFLKITTINNGVFGGFKSIM